jgi:hypothetical protein
MASTEASRLKEKKKCRRSWVARSFGAPVPMHQPPAIDHAILEPVYETIARVRRDLPPGVRPHRPQPRPDSGRARCRRRGEIR